MNKRGGDNIRDPNRLYTFGVIGSVDKFVENFTRSSDDLEINKIFESTVQWKNPNSLLFCAVEE